MHVGGKGRSLRDLLFLQDRMNRLFENSMRDRARSRGREWMPHVDIYEDDSAITLKASCPACGGRTSCWMPDGTLISPAASRWIMRRAIECYHIIERQYGSFKRSVTFSDNVKIEGIEARFENGVLEVVLPKIAQESVRQIPITSG